MNDGTIVLDKIAAARKITFKQFMEMRQILIDASGDESIKLLSRCYITDYADTEAQLFSKPVEVCGWDIP